jgi:4'-phosphopantetheinyl transferase
MSYSTIFRKIFHYAPDLILSNLDDAINVFVQKVPPLNFAEMSVLASVLDAEERKRHYKLTQMEQRKTFLVSHAALRLLLASVTGQRPEQIRYVATSYGKPGIMGNYPLHFNLSHSGRAFAIALSETELGVDIQQYVPSIDVDVLRLLCLTREECRKMDMDQNIENRKYCFFSFWAMKEAYIKFVGYGLSIPLMSFQCVKDDKSGRYIVIEMSEMYVKAKGVSFSVYNNSYQAAVSWSGKEDKHVRIYNEALC